MKIARLLSFVLVCFAVALASQLATRQLVVDLDNGTAYLNGSPVGLSVAPRVIEGRTLLPVREIARVLGLPLEPTNNGAVGFRLGKLELYPALKLARLDGKQVTLAEVGALQEDTVFVAARVLEAAIGATIVFDPIQRLMTLTVLPGVAVRDTSRPVARFSTDKKEYRIGEPVRIIEYSYDPDGLSIAKNFSGREDAYFTPGPKDITLVVTNRAGKTSEPYTVRIMVRSEVFANQRDYALRYLPVGRTFLDGDVLGYPVLNDNWQDDEGVLLVSDSPEEPKQSGVLYEDVISGKARLLAYHLNALPTTARLAVLATNVDDKTVSLQLDRLGETSATRVVSVLGQVSLMDFLTSSAQEQLSLAPGQSLLLYGSAPLSPGQGLNLMADLHSSGSVTLSILMLEESLLLSPEIRTNPSLLLSTLPVLEPDGIHIRGTFAGAVRSLKVRLDGSVGIGRIVIGDGVIDPKLVGEDALTDQPVMLPGNYGVTYKITLEGALGTVGAFAPRGGIYSGAISVDGLLMAVPENGVLYRPNNPLLLFRELKDDTVELELIPASGSYLPVNLIVYRLDGNWVAQNR